MAKTGNCQVCGAHCCWLAIDGALFLYGCCSAACLEQYYLSVAALSERLGCDPKTWKDEAAKVAERQI